MSKKELRQRILRRAGVKPSRPLYRPVEPDVTGRKTLAMILLERTFDTPIEQLLAAGSLREVAQKLGVSKSTVSIWNKRLGMRGRNGYKSP